MVLNFFNQLANSCVASNFNKNNVSIIIILIAAFMWGFFAKNLSKTLQFIISLIPAIVFFIILPFVWEDIVYIGFAFTIGSIGFVIYEFFGGSEGQSIEESIEQREQRRWDVPMLFDYLFYVGVFVLYMGNSFM